MTRTRDRRYLRSGKDIATPVLQRREAMRRYIINRDGTVQFLPVKRREQIQQPQQPRGSAWLPPQERSKT